MSITDKVRYIRITDRVQYTRNTDFIYNGQKTLVPTGTLYVRFTVLLLLLLPLLLLYTLAFIYLFTLTSDKQNKKITNMLIQYNYRMNE